MPMRCSNPACKNTTFEAHLLRKESNPKLPFQVVKLNCMKCGKQFRVWVVNPQLKEIYVMVNGMTQIIEAGLEVIYEQLGTIKAEPQQKNFFTKIKERLGQ